MNVRVLIVDDDPAVRSAMRRAFHSAGIFADTASTVREGMLKLGECDVALIDLDLPDGDGTDLLREIRLGSRPIRAAIYSGKPNGSYRGGERRTSRRLVRETDGL